QREKLLQQRAEIISRAGGGETGGRKQEQAHGDQGQRSAVRRDVPLYSPPDYEKHILRNYPLSHLKPYVNMRMLLGKHLGVRGNVTELLQQGDEKALEIKGVVDEVFQEAMEKG